MSKKVIITAALAGAATMKKSDAVGSLTPHRNLQKKLTNAIKQVLQWFMSMPEKTMVCQHMTINALRIPMMQSKKNVRILLLIKFCVGMGKTAEQRISQIGIC